MIHPIFKTIQKPTLLLNPEQAISNIHWMAAKARAQGIKFRPHFKTHQSAEIGEWFRAEGVTAITVSSLDMGMYFAENGWKDITLAFPVNLRQADDLLIFAQQVKLGLLVESIATVLWLKEANLPVELWIKVDSGAHRTGIPWHETSRFIELLSAASGLSIRGLLTHAGSTYGAGDPAAVYTTSTERMLRLRGQIEQLSETHLEVSVGDTPGCTLAPNLGAVDEIRPGNFVFYDAEQTFFGSCSARQVAVAAACPIVALHPERETVVIYGGAIHLSKDCWTQDGHPVYGLVALPAENGWSEPIPGAYVSALSQEHGVLHVPATELPHFKIGGLVCILPAHSCLTAQALGRYLTLDGRWIEMFHSNL